MAKSRKNRAGRKLKMVTRTPSGQPSRAKAVMQPREDPRAVAWDQRKRHLGLKDGEERSQHVTSTHGLLYEKGSISRDAYLVCERYAVAQRRFSQAIGGPRITGGARCYGETPGRIEGMDRGDDPVRAFEEVVAIFANRPGWYLAVRNVVVNDIPPVLEIEREKFRAGVDRLAAYWGMPLEPVDDSRRIV